MAEKKSAKVPNTAIKAERGDSNPLDQLEAHLRNVVFGQNRAIESIVRGLNRAQFGFAAGRSDRPIAVLLFLGPTGVGKTETAKRLAEFLHPNAEGLLKIDCSLFSHGHEIAALVGAPPAYVGREQRPLFDPEIIGLPNSVILFDEVEKASVEFWHLMLQIMEDGEVTLLNGGQRASFRKSIIIMTTNAGAREMADYIHGRRLGFSSRHETAEMMGANIYSIGFHALQNVFTPEWLNRLDEVVAFRPLSYETLGQILDQMLVDANEGHHTQGIHVELTADAKELVLRKSFTPEFGARPLRARVMKEIEAPLADLLASGGIPRGSRVWIDTTGDDEFGRDLAFYFEGDEALLAAAQEHGEPGVFGISPKADAVAAIVPQAETMPSSSPADQHLDT